MVQLSPNLISTEIELKGSILEDCWLDISNNINYQFNPFLATELCKLIIFSELINYYKAFPKVVWINNL